MQHTLEMVQDKVYGFCHDREEASLICILIQIGKRLKAKLIAQNLVEHVKARSDCIKHFNQSFENVGDSPLARAVSQLCLDAILAAEG